MTFNGINVLDVHVADHLPGGRERRRDDHRQPDEPRRRLLRQRLRRHLHHGGADIDAIDLSLSSIADARASLGAIQNRLEHTIANLATYHENLSAAESRIRDTDMAFEMTTFTKLQILQQSGVAMLATGEPGARARFSRCSAANAAARQTLPGSHPPGSARRQDGVGLRSGTTIASVIGPRDASPARADPDHLPTGRRGSPRRPVCPGAARRVRGGTGRALARNVPCTWRSRAWRRGRGGATAAGPGGAAAAPGTWTRRALARNVPCTWTITARKRMRPAPPKGHRPRDELDQVPGITGAARARSAAPGWPGRASRCRTAAGSGAA